MPMRIIARRTSATLNLAGEDHVFFYCPVPKDGVWMGASLDIHIIGVNTILTDLAKPYGISGYFIPVNDPTALPADPDDFWDQQVPKDSAVDEDLLDLSHGTDQDAEISIGVPALEMMLDAHQGPIKLFRTERMMSFAQGGRTMVTTAAAETYVPIDRFRLTTKKMVRAKSKQGVVMFALSNSNAAISNLHTGDIQAWAPGHTSAGVTNAELEWLMLKWMQKTVEDSAVFLAPGGVETGAIRVPRLAAELAGRMVDQAFESSNDRFDTTMVLQLFSMGSGTIIVPGRPNLKTLKGA